MAGKRYDEMTREELDAWYERHQRWRGVRAFLVLLLVFTIAWAAWFALRVWHEHSEAYMRAERQRQYQELRRIEMQENAADPSLASPCTPSATSNCAQPETVAPHTIDTSVPAVPVSQ